MRPGVQRAIVAVTTMMTTFLVMLDMTIANVALDHMRGTLSAGVDEITWVLTSFLVANAISLPVTGWLTDMLGRKRLFIVATVAFTITSGVTGAAPSLVVIVLMRFSLANVFYAIAPEPARVPCPTDPRPSRLTGPDPALEATPPK